MSYRDLRNFSEHLRILGFPHHVSLESFREPNFPLLVELVKWLSARFDPEAEVSGGGGTVEDRVTIIRSVAKFMATKANIKLNTKKLYSADGHAVRELLKVTAVLTAALSGADRADPPDDNRELQYDVSAKIGDIKQARLLATEITAKGAYLYDLLTKEPEHKEIREQALARQLDMAQVERTLVRALDTVRAQVDAARERIDGVAASEAALQAKIDKKRSELERTEARLQTMQKIKPAYQGELNALQKAIESLWEQYVLRYRCVEALKHDLSKLERAHAEAAEEQQAAIQQLIHKYEAEDVLGNVSDSDESGSSEGRKESLELKEPRPATRPKTRLRIKTAGGTDESRARVFGSMVAKDELDELRDEDSQSQDSELSEPPPPSRYGPRSEGRASSRYGVRPQRPLPAPSLDDEDDFADIVQSIKGDPEARPGSSLGSSSESELQLTQPRPPTTTPAPYPLSDDEF